MNIQMEISDSQYRLLRKIRTLSATVGILTYLLLQANKPIQLPTVIPPYDIPHNVIDTTKKETAPIEYNPRGGKVFLAKNQQKPSF